MQEKILLIGGTKGIGRDLALNLLKNKYKIYTISRNKIKKSDELNSYKDLVHLKYDLSKNKNVKNLISYLKKKKITFSKVVHLVGGSSGKYNINSNYDDYKKVWDLNFGYVIDINNFLIKNMIKKKGGKIIHLTASAVSSLSAPIAYICAKSALNTYIRKMGQEYIKFGIIFSAISLGPVEIKGRYMANEMKNNSTIWKKFKDYHLPGKRLTKTREVINVINFLISDLASYNSGAIWNVDGSYR